MLRVGESSIYGPRTGPNCSHHKLLQQDRLIPFFLPTSLCQHQTRQFEEGTTGFAGETPSTPQAMGIAVVQKAA